MKNKLRAILSIFKNFILGDHIKSLIKHNNYYFKDKNNYDKEFLFDYFESYEAEIARSYFVNVFRKKYQCNLTVFGIGKNILLNYKWRKLYKSINVEKFKYIFFSFKYLKFIFDFKKRKSIEVSLKKIKSKTDFLDFKYKDIIIGKDIYDEYLYRYKKITLDINDINLSYVVYDFIYTIDYWIDYFREKNVIGIALSHPNVRLLGIIGKVASKHFTIPVYSVTNTYIKKNNNLYDHYKYINDTLLQLPNLFLKIEDDQKENALNWSKKQLNKRLRGEVGVDMHYSRESAFGSFLLDRALNETDKIKVLICTHEFHDNPHSTGGLLFPDFYEWLLYLGKKSIKSNYEWYIKNHPDCDLFTKNIIDSFVKKFPTIKLVNEKTSFLQLKDEGLNFVFTCHGTVGHECPLLGIQVINADLNHPHIAYNFNWSPKNLNELSEIITNLDKLDLKINLDEVYEYYYTVNKMNIEDGLIFNSYKDAKKIEREENKNISNIFLEQFNEKKHYAIIEKILKII